MSATQQTQSRPVSESGVIPKQRAAPRPAHRAVTPLGNHGFLKSGYSLQRKCAWGGTSGQTGECDKCATERLQRQATDSSPGNQDRYAVPSIVGEVLNSPGQALDPETRTLMEEHFEYDFSQVRVHTGARAAESARAVNAQAYTVGQHIVFDKEQTAAAGAGGQRLLAHELTHVVQQGGGNGAGASTLSAIDTNAGSSRLEFEADAMADHVAGSWPSSQSRPATSAISQVGASSLQRKAPNQAASAPPKPALGPCHPVQDDLRPTKSWADLQKGYLARCSTATADVTHQLGSSLNDILDGKLPPMPQLPDMRSSVDCACAYGTPATAAAAAMAVVISAGPLAAKLYAHFLGASGTEVGIDVADMINRSAGVRAKIKQSIAGGGMTGTTRLEQHEYQDRELQFAYGAIDCVQWRALPPAGHSWRSNGATLIEVGMLDYYEFHPNRPGVSQCAHAACVQLVAQGDAKNFWTRGDATVTWADIKR